MFNPRQLALEAYYYGTYPIRSKLRTGLAEQGSMPLCCLFYHRVADTHPNSWSMTNRQFQQQMLWLKDNFEILSLPDLQARMQKPGNDRVAVSITFDDGYADNFDQAIPFLLDHNIPFTYFVSLDFILHNHPFPQDLAAGVPLRPNTPQQIRELAEAGVEIGAHTRSHCDVGKIDSVEIMIDEIVTARDELSDVAGTPIRYFAFPYGLAENMSAAAVHLARQSDMWGVCSAYGAYNFAGDDPFHIQRIHGDPEFIRLKNWLTIDGRKLNVGRDFRFPETAVKVGDLSLADQTAPSIGGHAS